MGWAEGDTFKEDFFERVVDVQWKKYGGVFVAGDVCCFNWYIRAKKKGGRMDIRFHGLGELSFHDGTTSGAAAGAVGKDKKNKIKGNPTFALGGSRGEGEGDSSVTICTIQTSRDGESWSETYSQSFGQGQDTPDMNGGNWNPKANKMNIGELTSSTGYGWSPGGGGGRGDGGGTNEKGEYHSAEEFGFDYLVYAGGIWCGAAGQTIMVAADDGEFAFQTAGSTDRYGVSCLCGVGLEDFPDNQQ
jgi:hypothetical protein